MTSSLHNSDNISLELIENSHRSKQISNITNNNIKLDEMMDVASFEQFKKYYPKWFNVDNFIKRCQATTKSYFSFQLETFKSKYYILETRRFFALIIPRKYYDDGKIYYKVLIIDKRWNISEDIMYIGSSPRIPESEYNFTFESVEDAIKSYSTILSDYEIKKFDCDVTQIIAFQSGSDYIFEFDSLIKLRTPQNEINIVFDGFGNNGYAIYALSNKELNIKPASKQQNKELLKSISKYNKYLPKWARKSASITIEEIVDEWSSYDNFRITEHQFKDKLCSVVTLLNDEPDRLMFILPRLYTKTNTIEYLIISFNMHIPYVVNGLWYTSPIMSNIDQHNICFKTIQDALKAIKKDYPNSFIADVTMNCDMRQLTKHRTIKKDNKSEEQEMTFVFNINYNHREINFIHNGGDRYLSLNKEILEMLDYANKLVSRESKFKIINKQEVTEMAKTEYVCTLENPELFDDKSFRRTEREHEGKPYYVVIGKKKGSASTSEQSYRYKMDEWDEKEAKTHCKSHNGEFVTVTKENKGINISNAKLSENIIQSTINIVASIDEEEIAVIKQIKDKVLSSDKTEAALKDNLAFIVSLLPDSDTFYNKDVEDVAVQEAFALYNSITDVDENDKWLLANIVAVMASHMRNASEIAGACNKYKDRFKIFKSVDTAFTIVVFEVIKKIFKSPIPTDCAEILVGLAVILLKDVLNVSFGV